MAVEELTKRVVIQKPGEVQDESGEPIPGWVPVAKVWAGIRYQSGMEVIKSDAPTSVVKASIRVRYRSGIAANMRAVAGATVFDIKAVLLDEADREYMFLVCETGASEG